MRDDLLDAQAAIDWAVTQIPLLEEGFVEWQRGRPYRIINERDSQTREHIISIEIEKLPPTFNAWVGAILNSLRSGLDILATSLAIRNNPVEDGKESNWKPHFPIFTHILDMIDPKDGIDGIKCKKWLSQNERATIKALKPYNGGDECIWTLHQLDLARKHKRLIKAEADVYGSVIYGNARMTITGTQAVERSEGKTILTRVSLGAGFVASRENVHPAIFIMINEPALGVRDEQVVPLLKKFAARTAEIITLFDV